MKNNTNNSNLIMAIVFASIIITGSIIFFGMQSKSVETSSPGQNIDKAIANGIENYIKKQQEDVQNAQKAQARQKKDVWKNLVKPNEKDYVRGNTNAEISIIEYSDYECPFCKRFHPTMKKVLDEYKGKVNWIYRDFPLGFHDPLATKQAVSARCVGKLSGGDKFWEYADMIFETTRSNGKGMEISDLVKIAVKIGIDEESFIECQNDSVMTENVKASIQEGSSAGVSGTPGSFILNNKTGKIDFINGAQPFENIKRMIDSIL